MHELGRVLHLPGFKPGAVAGVPKLRQLPKNRQRALTSTLPSFAKTRSRDCRLRIGHGRARAEAGAVADPARPQTSSQRPLFSERKSASITRMLATASSTP